MDDSKKREENDDIRRDRPTIRFETIVEPADEPEYRKEEVVEEVGLKLPHRVPEETPKIIQEEVPVVEPVAIETPTEESQTTRFDELAKALSNGAVESGSEVSNKNLGRRKIGWGWLALILIFIFGAGLGVVGGYVMWGNQFDFTNQPDSSNTENTPLFNQNPPKTITPTVLPSITPVTADRSKIVLQVLNGSGVIGAASEIKDHLEGLGYKNVAVGNASRSDYPETTISIKESKKTNLQVIMADIERKMKVATETAKLAETSAYDAVVTLGKN